MPKIKLIILGVSALIAANITASNPLGSLQPSLLLLKKDIVSINYISFFVFFGSAFFQFWPATTMLRVFLCQHLLTLAVLVFSLSHQIFRRLLISLGPQISPHLIIFEFGDCVHCHYQIFRFESFLYCILKHFFCHQYNSF
jgi:hypothetical protein